MRVCESERRVCANISSLESVISQDVHQVAVKRQRSEWPMNKKKSEAVSVEALLGPAGLFGCLKHVFLPLNGVL